MFIHWLAAVSGLPVFCPARTIPVHRPPSDGRLGWPRWDKNASDSRCLLHQRDYARSIILVQVNVSIKQRDSALQGIQSNSSLTRLSWSLRECTHFNGSACLSLSSPNLWNGMEQKPRRKESTALLLLTALCITGTKRSRSPDKH